MTPPLTLTSQECWFLPAEGSWTLDDALEAMTSKFALALNGVPLKYALPIPGQSGFWRTYLTGTLLGALKKPDKESLPCLELWSAVLKLVVADFDSLPVVPGLAWDWETFRAYLSWRYGHLGLVVESPSGKAKIVFVVRIPDGASMTTDIALDTLDWLLDPEEREVIDRTPAALTQFLLREKAFSLLQERLNLLPVHPAILDSTEEPEETTRWHLFEGEVPDMGLNDLQEFLIRYILGSSKLALAKIALSQPYLVRQAEMKGFSFKSMVAGQKQVSRALEKFQEMGLLEVVNGKWFGGKRAKTYRAAGVLKDLAEEILANLPDKEPHVPPASIAAGAWNRILLHESNYHLAQETYEQWFYSLDGCMDKDREAQMRKVWKWHIEHL